MKPKRASSRTIALAAIMVICVLSSKADALAAEQSFFTGKPYLPATGSYAFKYRSYQPELARWTSEDPSGFPDGANANIYAPTPTSEFDWMGLRVHHAYANKKHTISLSVYVYDHTNTFTNSTMSAWKSAVESGWKYSGENASNGEDLSFGVNISFALQSGGVFNSNWISSYDNVIQFTDDTTRISGVVDYFLGIFRTDITASEVVHEVGHFMNANDMYNERIVNGVRLTDPKDGWGDSIMGAAYVNASKRDVNHVLQRNLQNANLFE